MAGMRFIVPARAGRRVWSSSLAGELHQCNSPGGPMPRVCAVVIELTAAERRVLRQRDRGGKTPWQDRVRAQIVRRAAQGQSNERIARELGITVDTVRCWRGRFAAGRLDGLGKINRTRR